MASAERTGYRNAAATAVAVGKYVRVPRRRILTLIAVSTGLVVASTGFGSGPAVALPTIPPQRPADTAPVAGTVLATLAVKGRAAKTGYARSKFGDGWGDEDHDGCSTREEILQRDLTGKTFRASGRCQVVVTGSLADPYLGRTTAFTRGSTTSALVQIDHVVALSNSWQTGAQQLTAAKRASLANDPLNLLAVDGRLNQQKGASDAASWLPPNKAYRCAYVARQVAVKARYGLWVTAAEKAAILRVLTPCPGQRIPVS